MFAILLATIARCDSARRWSLKFSDREILDATLVISYFNFVNRNVLALGVELEEDPSGFNY